MFTLAVMLEIAETLRSRTGLPFNEVYCASKFAVEGACESLAILLQHFNIQSVFFFFITTAFFVNSEVENCLNLR